MTTPAQLMSRYTSERNNAIARGDTERADQLNRERDRSMEALARFLGITDFEASTGSTMDGATGVADPSRAATAPRVRGVAAAWAAIDVDGVRGMSPEALLLYAQVETRNIDTQVSNLMGDMQDTSRRSNALRAASDRINAWAGSHHDNAAQLNLNSREPGDMVEISNADGTTESVTISEALQRAGVPATALSTQTWRRDDMQGLRDILQQHGQRLNDGSEQRSMALQNLMSRRSQVLQLTTQMLTAMSEASKGILGNIGR